MKCPKCKQGCFYHWEIDTLGKTLIWRGGAGKLLVATIALGQCVAMVL